MASESGEESREESMKELSAEAVSRSRTPSNQDNISPGKKTPSKASTIHDEHINADQLASGAVSREPSVISNRQGSNLTPIRVSADVSGSIAPSDLEEEPEPEPPPPPPSKIQPNVMVDASLSLLATHIVQKRLILAMYLNVPTAELVITDNTVREERTLHKRPPTLDQLQEQLQRQIDNKPPAEPPQMLSVENIDQEVAFRLLKLWRSLKGDAKDKDKVAELVRALKLIERTDLGDIIVTQNLTNEELTEAVLPVLEVPSANLAATSTKKIRSGTKTKK